MVELKMFIPRMPHRPHNELSCSLAKQFGGITMSWSIGMWYDATGVCHTEAVDVFTCYIPDTPEAMLQVEELARQYKAAAEQIEVLYSINGSPTFIKD